MNTVLQWAGGRFGVDQVALVFVAGKVTVVLVGRGLAKRHFAYLGLQSTVARWSLAGDDGGAGVDLCPRDGASALRVATRAKPCCVGSV